MIGIFCCQCVSVHSTLIVVQAVGFSPAFMLYRRDLDLPLEHIVGGVVDGPV